jgi:hypothetical protein
MKIGKTIIHALSVSQIRGFQAFMADKQPHRFCGKGINSRIQIAGSSAKSIFLDKARNKYAATDESIDGSHSKHREARSPP